MRPTWRDSTLRLRLRLRLRPGCSAQLANLWDVSGAPTIVMTQRGTRRAFQAALRDQGVEVVEFDFLTPEAVSYYCYDRGFLQVCNRPVSNSDQSSRRLCPIQACTSTRVV